MKKNTSACFAALRANLPFDRRRVELLAAFLIALIQQNTCNLARLANVLDLSAKTESRYKRLKRFCRSAPLDFTCLARLVVAIGAPPGKYILALDRTEWRLGSVWINIVTLAVVVGKSSFPVFWLTLNRKGNTTLAEREQIVTRFVEVFGAASIEYLSADREFDSYHFVRSLDKLKIGFRLRVRVQMKTQTRCGKTVEFSQMLSKMVVGGVQKLRKGRRYGGVKVYIEMEKGVESKDSVIVISSEKSRSILLDYKRRWAIETLFQNLKGRGFEVERTHLRSAERIDRLFGVLSLAVAWAMKTGEMQSRLEPLKLKKNGRPPKSLFRLGCEIIQEFLMEVKNCSKIDVIKILRC